VLLLKEDVEAEKELLRVAPLEAVFCRSLYNNSTLEPFCREVEI